MNRKIILLKILILLPFLFSQSLSAQQPTRQEMEEMQKMMKQMSSDPEMQKAMKQFGMDSNSIEKMMSSSQSSAAGSGSYYEFDEFQTPQKNLERINLIPKQRLTNKGMSTYLQHVEKSIDASLTAGDRQMVDFLNKQSKSSPDSLANMASGLWLTGNYVPAAYFMGKACGLNPNVTNLNNFSAFLVMTGGEELALPILQKLNRENPKNSTILNNIGQAWFGLGDLDIAGKYLDSTIMILATHSQANQTMCVIRESKGDKTGAEEAMRKSIDGAYSPAKEAMMRKLGYQISGEELSRGFHMPQDALGFDKWIARIPPFPKNAKEQRLLGPAWDAFYTDVEEELAKLQGKTGKLTEESQQFEMKRAKKFAADPQNVSLKPPYLSNKMSKILKYYTNDKDGHYAYQAKKLASQITALTTDLQNYRNAYRKKVAEITKKESEHDGEGMGGGNENSCLQIKKVFNEYLNTTNTEREQVFKANIDYQKKMLEATAYLNQFITDNQAGIDLVENNVKIRFLQNFPRAYYDQSILQPNLDYSDVASCIDEEENTPKKTSLSNWDDLHCDKNITFRVPGIGYCNFDCNSTTVKLDPVVLPYKGGFKQDLNTGEFINASAAIGYGPAEVGGEYDFVKEKGSAYVQVGKDLVDEKVGGIKVKAGVTGKATLEFDKDGLSDFTLEAYGGVKAGNDAVKVSGDAKVNWSWEAGGSGDAKGSMDSKAVNTAIKAINYMK
jgi:hypothetical protein